MTSDLDLRRKWTNVGFVVGMEEHVQHSFIVGAFYPAALARLPVVEVRKLFQFLPVMTFPPGGH